MNEGQIKITPKMSEKVLKYREKHKKCQYCKHLKIVVPKLMYRVINYVVRKGK